MSLAQAQLIQLKQKFDEQPNLKSITVTAPTDEAVANLQALGFTVTHVPGTKDVTVTASTDAAKKALDDYINNNNGRVINLVAHVNPTTGLPKGADYAQGGIVEHYAAGALRPMRGGYATIVPPNTWRVIGDRVRDDEAYIPITRTARSIGILTETAARMGYQLVRAFAVGGITTQSTSATPAAAAGSPVINTTINAVDGPSAYEIGRVAAARIGYELRRR
jgi:hypothetical protein